MAHIVGCDSLHDLSTDQLDDIYSTIFLVRWIRRVNSGVSRTMSTRLYQVCDCLIRTVLTFWDRVVGHTSTNLAPRRIKAREEVLTGCLLTQLIGR